MRPTRPRLRLTVRPALACLVAVTLSACGSSGGGSSAKSQITDNWERAFSPTTSVQEKTSLVQNGQAFTEAMDRVANSALTKQVHAEVTRVAVHGDRADVTYTVYRGEVPELKGRHGTAVLVDGVWQLSQGTVCALLALGQIPAAPCTSSPPTSFVPSTSFATTPPPTSTSGPPPPATSTSPPIPPSLSFTPSAPG